MSSPSPPSPSHSHLDSNSQSISISHRHITIAKESLNESSLSKEPLRKGPPKGGPGTMNNKVITSQYTLWNFLFLNLYKQFSRPANCYFFFICCLQMIKAVSITNGLPTTAPALLFVLMVTAIKDAIEDYNRHIADHVENTRKTRVLDPEDKIEEIEKEWQNIKVGELVVVRNREPIPADLLLLESSEDSGLAYVMTANLDGETNLKAKEVHKDLLPYSLLEKTNNGEIICDLPNNRLGNFEATLKCSLPSGEQQQEQQQKQQQEFSLSARNLLLRGCVLRNTQWAIGVAVYTGKESKIQMNAAETPFKVGSMKKFTDKMVFLVFCIQIVCCFIGGIFGASNVRSTVGQNLWYVWNSQLNNNGIGNNEVTILNDIPNPNFLGFLQFWTFIIIFTNFIPISLLVTLDVVKFFQAYFMMQNLAMYHEMEDNEGQIVEVPMKVKSSDLNEELGCVNHIFSDKTGTLTCNIMEFCKCSIGGQSFGLGITQIGRAYMERNNIPIVEPPARNPLEPTTPFVNINDPNLMKIMKDPRHPDHQEAQDFFLHLSLNHDVMPERRSNTNQIKPGKDEDDIIYSASSPDESALVYAAKHFGFFFCKREPGSVQVKVNEILTDFKVLHVFEFTSDRKKSSVLLRRQENNSLILFTKGADNIIKARLDSRQLSLPKVQIMLQQLNGYVNDGLRTLLLAKRNISEGEYQNWLTKYQAAETSLVDRDAKRWALMEELELKLEVMGVTAIEDKLQDGVPRTLKALRQAHIKVWMLTGDKVDTAINIGYSCSLLSTDMEIFRLCGDSDSQGDNNDSSNEHEGRLQVDKEGVPTLTSMMTVMENILGKMQRLQEDAPLTGQDQGGRGRSGSGNNSNNSNGNTQKGNRKACAIVVDTYALTSIMTNELEDLFVAICKYCESVICARVSPKQKAEVVSMLRKAEPKAQTLSIGDGANDVPMIQTAHIGIGIFGVEGQQAVNSSDFAIGQFRFLHDLLLVHGRWNLRRNSMIILYMFYKNALLVLPQFFFGVYSFFSGQNFYYDGFYQPYNVIYTSFPILFLALWDKDVDYHTARNNPLLYFDGLERAFLNTWIFLRWMGEGLIHALIITLLPIYMSSGYWSIYLNGQVASLWDLGTIVFLNVICVASLRIAFEVKDWNPIITTFILLSICSWWLSYVYYDTALTLLGGSLFGAIPNTLSSGTFWLPVLAGTCLCFLISFFIESISVFFFPTRAQILKERIHHFQDLSSKVENIGLPSIFDPCFCQKIKSPWEIEEETEDEKEKERQGKEEGRGTPGRTGIKNIRNHRKNNSNSSSINNNKKISFEDPPYEEQDLPMEMEMITPNTSKDGDYSSAKSTDNLLDPGV